MPAASTDAAGPALRFDASDGDALLHWYDTEQRDLPWRRTSDPYRILVSEIMLQQTRVETVTPRYTRFLERFPDVGALAAAPVDDVLAEWSGLGYYRRARSLHAAAITIGDELDGEFPRTYEQLKALPGIGDYTAAAIAGIAFGEPRVGIDGNVVRVLCRYFGIADDPVRAAVHRRLKDAAESLLVKHPPGQVTQALMELGARVCTPRSPRCDECVLAARCIARIEERQAGLPIRRKQIIRDVAEAAAVIERNGSLLLVRGQRPGLLAGMWEFPALDSRGAAEAQAEGVVAESPAREATGLVAYLAQLGIQPRAMEPLGEIRHGITNRRITCTVYRAAAESEPEPEAPAGSGIEIGWFTAAEASQIPLAASATRILELLASD